MHGSSGRVLAVKQKSAISVYVGLAALVLEGRALGGEDDDENFLRSSSPHSSLRSGVTGGEEVEVSNVNVSPPSSVATSASARSNSGGVIHRISEKLMRLRQFPGTSRELDVVETSIAIPVHDGEQYERQSPRLHHVASAREFQRNLRLTSIPASSSSNLSAAASVLHDIDVDWNDISILLNGLDPIVNVPAFPLKLSSPAPNAHIHHLTAFRSSHSMSINQDSPRMKLTGKTPQSREKATCSSPPLIRPKQGPHCEKFLKKLGLLRPETPELDMDHMCNHVNNYVNIFLKSLLNNNFD